MVADFPPFKDLLRTAKTAPTERRGPSVPGGLSFSAGEHVTYPAWDSVT